MILGKGKFSEHHIQQTVISATSDFSENQGKRGVWETWERCLSGAFGRSTCPRHLMKRPMPMNLVTGSRLAPGQRNASLPRFPHAPLSRPPSHPRPPSPKHHILFPNISGLEACPNASCLVIRPSFTNRCRLASMETISPPAEEYISPSI